MGRFKLHHPPHLFVDNCVYFVTGATIGKLRAFRKDNQKQVFLEVLNKSIDKFHIELMVWILLDNHYHMLIRLVRGHIIRTFIQNLHSNSSRLLNRLENQPGRKLWWNYWERCMRNEANLYTHLNYIHHNCVKHGYIEDIQDYKWSSYMTYLKRYGKEWLESCFAQYPIKDFTPQGDE